MRLGGYQKLTLIDYPGKIATTVFTVGCSFRCGFCHNPELVLPEKFPCLPAGRPHSNQMEKEFFEHLEKRKGKLEGVCITGGEPTIQADIVEFIRKIKSMGYAVKLDSNGTMPEVLEKVFQEKLVDYVAMDIKSCPAKYLETAGIGGREDLLENIRKSIKLIMESGVPYEFRTTVVPGIHSEQDFEEIAQWIKGAKLYYLQEYREDTVLDENIKNKTLDKSLDLEKIGDKIKPFFQDFGIRKNN